MITPALSVGSMEIGPGAPLLGQILSFLLTALNTAIQAMKLGDHAAAHGRGRILFAGLQRDFATRLSLDTFDPIVGKYQMLASKFNEAKMNSVGNSNIFNRF